MSSMYAYDGNPFEPQRSTFETMRYIIDTTGQERNCTISSGTVQVGLGPGSWDQLESYFTQRGVRAEITGPYFTYWHSGVRHHSVHLGYEISVVWKAIALIKIEQDADVVRFERDAMRAFPIEKNPFQTHRLLSDHEIEKHRDIRASEAARYVDLDLIRVVRESAGGLPGEHRCVRTPVSLIQR